MLITGATLPFYAWAVAPVEQSGKPDRGDGSVPAINSKTKKKVDPGAAKGTGTKATVLVPIVVTGAADIPVYQKEISTAGTKFPLESTRVPQSIQIITETAIEDQGDLSIGDIVKQVPSASVFGSRFSRFPSVNIRGFEAQQTRNGIRQLFFGDVDFSALSNIQSVEVLKGPGSTVFGQNGSGGGIINIITKRPYDRLGAEVNFTRGGWTGFDGDITSGQWDFNTPLAADGALKARFTGAVERTDTFIRSQDLNRENFGLGLTYDPGGPVRGFINAEYQHRQTLPNPGLPAIGTVQSSGVGQISRDTFLGEPKFDNLTIETPLAQAWVEMDVLKDWNGILKNWKVTPRFQYFEFSGNQDQMFLGATSVNPVKQQINVSRSGRSGFKERDSTYIGQIDLTGNLKTGPLSHQIYFGGDYTNYSSGGGWLVRSNVPAIDALDPVFLNAPLATNPDRLRFDVKWEVSSFAFQDEVSITPYFDLLGGVRHSIVTGQRTTVAGITTKTDTTNTSFQLGGTFHVTNSVHLFAGFGEGFNVADAVGFGTASGKPFKLGESNQVEAGVKINFPWGLTGTASLFRILRTNVTTPDRENPGFQVQTGEVRSRGAEVELAYQVTEQWYFQSGYSFTDAQITQSNAGDVGNRFQNIPKHQANLWTHYRINNGLLRNLTLSAGMNFVGDRPLDNANTVELPNYTIMNLGASYTYKNVKLELFADNVLDRRYFIANDVGLTVFPGTPRTIMGRVSLTY
jgi:iron complex outermembrane receptor protein